ncbi:hypothetical protein NNO_0961 [Hydrogenimonas sp.]|nr:hypothetical protein NNO_0961 [Hydrogenimonas sp.]
MSKLYALSSALQLDEGLDRYELISTMEGSVIAGAGTMGRYGR